MDAKTLNSFTPANQTSAGISAALASVATAKAAALAAAASVAAEQSANALTSTSRQRRDLADAIADAEADAAQCDAIAASLDTALAVAVEAERRKALSAMRAAIMARISEFERGFLERYLAAETIIRELLDTRDALADEVGAHNGEAGTVTDLRIADVVELDRPRLNRHFFKTSTEILAEKQAAENDRLAEYHRHNNARAERHRLAAEEYAARVEPAPGPVVYLAG